MYFMTALVFFLIGAIILLAVTTLLCTCVYVMKTKWFWKVYGVVFLLWTLFMVYGLSTGMF